MKMHVKADLITQWLNDIEPLTFWVHSQETTQISIPMRIPQSQIKKRVDKQTPQKCDQLTNS